MLLSATNKEFLFTIGTGLGGKHGGLEMDIWGVRKELYRPSNLTGYIVFVTQ